MEADDPTGTPHNLHSVLGKREAGSDTAHRAEQSTAPGGGRPAAESRPLHRIVEEKGEEPCCEHKEQLEEARRLLDLAMRELEATRAAAAAQSQLHDARAHTLEEQLRVARAERDAAHERIKALGESERARARAHAEPPSPSTTLLFETPLPSPNPTVQIAQQLADVRQQLEQIRQQRAVPVGTYPSGSQTAHPTIPSRSEDPSGDPPQMRSTLPPPMHRIPSPMPNLPTTAFSLPPVATESVSTATPSVPNPRQSPGPSFQPSAAASQPSEPIPRAPFRTAPPFHTPAQPSVSQAAPPRQFPPEPPGMTLPRQGELLRTIERAAPLLNILMLGSLGPLPRWKNPPYAARPPPAPALLRHVPAPSYSPSIPGGQSFSAPGPPPLYGEAPRASVPATSDPASLHVRSPLAHPSNPFSAPAGASQLTGQSPGSQSWQYAQAMGEASSQGAQNVASQPHPHPFSAPRLGGETDPHGLGLDRPGQTSRQVQAGTSQVSTALQHMRGQT
ncbi:hypothetical protein KFL_004990070 [Klebsormidium nitens]|uniref:Uncharacterized protein n=1 Tax=Klebsormidium nitens TaxID=105231 RepID=A0A1Y1IGN4_KLENI|nr:hypothetical protein KFL_004990070 [Klebsormidium nitens]|eukprot:GAQ89222.1 hypothetical protein KFL_004990070 [Klebsormidium nitens]